MADGFVRWMQSLYLKMTNFPNLQSVTGERKKFPQNNSSQKG